MTPTTRNALALLLLCSSPCWPQHRYTIQPAAESRVRLLVAKTGLYSGKVHEFEFAAFAGHLMYDSANPAVSGIELVLQAGSLKLKDRWLSDSDFKEVQRYALEDMLAAKQFPQIRFVSSTIVAMDSTSFKVGGDLTIRDRTNPVVVNVTLRPSRGGVLAFQGKAIVKLTDFGLKPPKAALGLIGTKNEMELTFGVSAEPVQ